MWLVALVVYAAVSLDKVEALSPDPIADTDGTVWLLVGSDSRDGLTKKEQKKLKTGDVEGQRTDTIMLVHQQLGQTPTLVSIPRDSWVTIPAHTASDGSLGGCARREDQLRVLLRRCAAAQRDDRVQPACMSTTTWRSAWAGS